MSEVGAALQQWRKRHDITQREVARVLEITDRTVARWESGGGEPSAHQLLELDAQWPGLIAAIRKELRP